MSNKSFHPVFPKNQKLNAKGKTTIYVRVTIDGLKDEFSSGIQVLPVQWDLETKTVRSNAPKAKDYNKKFGQIKADLERHFDYNTYYVSYFSGLR